MRKFIAAGCFSFISCTLFAQDDLLSMLETDSAEAKKIEFTTATFKTTRIINGHSVENAAPGVLDLRISHRFGFISAGAYELFGLDQASMRIGLDYGLTNRWMIGIGRSTFQKQFDGFTKFKILRQAVSHMPVTVSITGSMMYKTLKFEDPARTNYISSNIVYSSQLLIGRKFNESLSLQLMPTMLHYNLVAAATDANDIFALGVGGRLKISKRVSINAEYYYQLPSLQFSGTENSLAVGFDIETGGHVFQLNFTNSTGMTERSFITETTGKFFKGDIHFGFTISRVFTLVKPQRPS